MKFNSFFAFLAAASLSVGCASASVRPDEPAVSDAETPAVQKTVAGMEKPKLHPQAEKIFASLDSAPGISAVVNLDALVLRGLIDDHPADPNGYTLAQILTPYFGEAVAAKASLAKPLAEAAVYVTLLDSAIDIHDIKRLGFWLPSLEDDQETPPQAGSENEDERISSNAKAKDQGKALAKKSVLIIGNDSASGDLETTLSAVTTVLRLIDRSDSELGKEAKETIGDEINDSANSESGKFEDLFKSEDGLTCLAKDDDKTPLCAAAGDGFLAVGNTETLKALLSMNSEGKAEGADSSGDSSYAKIHVDLPEVGIANLNAAGEEDGGLTVKVNVQLKDEEEMVSLKQLAEMAIQRRTQASSEFRKAVSDALTNVQGSLGSMEKVPEKMKSSASKMTADSILDPHGVGLNDPNNVVFEQEGSSASLTLRMSAAHVDHIIGFTKNAGMLRYKLPFFMMGAVAGILLDD